MEEMLFFINEKTQSDVQIIFFPHAGGSGQVYLPWKSLFPSTIQLIAIELPGRGRMIDKACIKNFSYLIHLIANNLIPVLADRFIFVGHSMGALLAYETTMYIYKYLHKIPSLLVIASEPAPHLNIKPKLDSWQNRDKAINNMKKLGGTPDELFQNEELLELSLGIMKADAQLLEDYLYSPVAQLSTPILAFSSKNDAFFTEEQISAWRDITASDFILHKLNGGHFSFHHERENVVKIILNNITK